MIPTPTAPGYYWARAKEGTAWCAQSEGVVEIVEVYSIEGVDRLKGRLYVSVFGLGDEVPPTINDFEWLNGPLTLPVVSTPENQAALDRSIRLLKTIIDQRADIEARAVAVLGAVYVDGEGVLQIPGAEAGNQVVADAMLNIVMEVYSDPEWVDQDWAVLVELAAKLCGFKDGGASDVASEK